MRRKIFIWVILVSLGVSCRERFEAEGAFAEGNFLVVDGFIQVGGGVTRIELSRVTKLNETSTLQPDADSEVFIEDNAGTDYTLHNRGNGLYESDVLNLDLDAEYRLRIESRGKTYLSSYTAPILTPAIDSVGWDLDSENFITVHVNTHDLRNNTFYYKWEYEEVWEIRTAYQSKWAYENGVARARPSEEIKRMSFCWPYRYNPDLVIASSKQLTSDAIRLFPLVKFHYSDARLGWRYSIRVTQRALSAEEYEFLQIMQKNTNDIGGFFDPQPSQLTGNMFCTTSDEPVVGYVGAYTSQQKQLIIKRDEISDFEYTTPCFFELINGSLEDPFFPDYLVRALPLDPIYGPFEDDAAPIVGFILVERTCADCRIEFGTAPKPDFWVAEDEGNVE